MDDSTVPLLKQCSKCKQLFPATTEYFMLHKGKLYSQCHECRRASKRENQARNPEANKARCAAWYQENREQELARKRAKNAANPEVNRARVRAWRKSNPDKRNAADKRRRQRYAEKERERIVRWEKAHPEHVRAKKLRRRAREANGTVTPADLKLILAQSGGTCWWCGVSVGDKFHYDHRVPLARGGTNNPENIVISCPTCNMSRQDKLPYEWGSRLL